jgi:hypothetical protein
MFAVIRITALYERLGRFFPFVTRSKYMMLAEVAATQYNRAWRARGDLKDAEAAAVKEKCQTREQHAASVKLITELNLEKEAAGKRIEQLAAEVVELRRRLLEEEQQCGRLAQLLREVNQITDSKSVQQKRIDYHVVKELLS